jgi:hypothetical protein
MTNIVPDRLCANAKSPFYDEAILERGVGIRFEGVEKTNVEEYCVSEGWIRVTAGTAKMRNGEPMTIKLKGKVEPYFRDEAGSPDD